MAGPPRPPNDKTQERAPLSWVHAQLTATTTDKFYVVDRRARVRAVRYFNKTGLAADAANYFAIQLKNGSKVLASHSTQTGAQGAITADTPILVPLTTTVDDLIVAAGETLSFAAVETGTATLPPGHIVVELTYL